MKIAVITCYDQNDYVRARTLRTALQATDGVETIIVRNRHKGLWRYPEVMWQILKLRFGSVKPDAYVITFRGYEMLAYMRLTGVRKPIIFDEMLNMVEYYREHGKLREGTWQDNLARSVYHRLVRGCHVVLADTAAHADYSAGVSRLPRQQFRVLPIAADETMFFPGAVHEVHKPFTVFYYANGMNPLHGLEYVLEAAVLLKDDKNIRFNIGGGKGHAAVWCAKAIKQGAQVDYETWINFEEIPARSRAAGICLGGPFGKTLQAEFVVTGKAVQFLACAAPVMIGENKVSGVFKDRENSLVVELANGKAIAGAIAWAVKHPAEMQKIGQNGRKTYERYFSQAVANKEIGAIVAGLGTK